MFDETKSCDFDASYIQPALSKWPGLMLAIIIYMGP